MDTVELVDTAERVQAQPVKQADFVTQAALRQRPHRVRTQGCCQAVPVEQAEQRRKRQGEGPRRHAEAVHGAGRVGQCVPAGSWTGRDCGAGTATRGGGGGCSKGMVW